METVEHLRPAAVRAVQSLQFAFYSAFHFLLNLLFSRWMSSPPLQEPRWTSGSTQLRQLLRYSWSDLRSVPRARGSSEIWGLWPGRIWESCTLQELWQACAAQGSCETLSVQNIFPSLCWKFLSLEAFSGVLDAIISKSSRLSSCLSGSGVPWSSDVHLIKKFSWSISRALSRGGETDTVCVCSHDWQLTDRCFLESWTSADVSEGSFVIPCAHFVSVFHPQVLEAVRNTIADDRVKIDVVEAFDPLPISPWDEQTFAIHIFQKTILDTFPDVDSVVPGDSKHMMMMMMIVSSSAFPSSSTALFPFAVYSSTPAVNCWKQLFFPLFIPFPLYALNVLILFFSSGSKKANRKLTETMSLELGSLHIQRNLFREERSCEGEEEVFLL